MSSKWKSLSCATVFIVFSTLAPAQTQNSDQQPPANGKFLFPVLAAALSSGVASGVTSFIGSLFNKLSNMVFGDPYAQQGFNQQPCGYPQPQYANQPQYAQPNCVIQAQPQYAMNQPSVTVPAQMNATGQTVAQGSTLQTNTTLISPPDGITPAIAYKIEQLDPTTFQTIRTFENVQNDPPRLKSGEVFAIIYEPNMPGQVRLENIDAMNTTSQLGTYNVVGRKPRRLPEKKGFQLSGVGGMEQINFYFTPCRPPEAQNQPGVVEFQKLPLCSNVQSTNLAKAGKSGGIAPKFLINQDSPDPSIAVTVSSDYSQSDLQNGTPVSGQLKVIHQGAI